MKFLVVAAFAFPLSAVVAAPTDLIGSDRAASGPELVPVAGGDAVLIESPVAEAPPVATDPAAEDPAAEDPAAEDPAAEDPAEGGEAGEGEEGGEAGEGGEGEEGEGNEVEVEAAFGDVVALEGGDIKQDVLYPPGVNGVFEVEFQNAEARTLTVTENPTPGAAPAGFQHVENTSYIVEIAEGAEGLTLQKIDYILNADNALDISQGQIGRFCAEAGVFVIDPALGELEFEIEENELTLTVANMNGEWAAFVPVAAGEDGAADEGAETDAGEGAGEGAGEDAGAGTALLDALRAFVGGGAA